MQLTMEPLDEMVASARAMDEAGMDTIWLAEAYPWWRKHGMEARSSTVASAVIARETERLTVGWGIISPFTRHPVQAAMDARVVQEAAGPGRFILGFGTSKIFLNNAKLQTKKTLGPMRDAVAIARGVLGGEAFEYEGSRERVGASARQLRRFAAEVPPVYVAATAPKVRHSPVRSAMAARRRSPRRPSSAHARTSRATSTSAARSSPRFTGDRDAGRDGAREIAAMYLANKVQSIGARPTRCSSSRKSTRRDSAGREAMEPGSRLAANTEVTDALLDKCKPIAGTPDDCIAAVAEYREAGCTHVMLELWGDRRHEQIRLFGERVLPAVRG
jgi:5,10-methylenetetrahydromethanopterin reductase